MMEGQRRERQSAIRMLAREYSDSSLTEVGAGEYDPSFVVTKLGARVNRTLVGGVIDRMERRDGDNGPSYTGSLRDPTGIHFFNIAPFQPELHSDAEELLARFESGDRFLMMLVGRSRWFEQEDGGVFMSLRTEQFAVCDKDTYSTWLVDAADATLRRIDAYEKSTGIELNRNSMESAGIPSDLVQGLVSAREHYPEFDSENYRVGVLQALSAASGRSSLIQEPEPEPENGSMQQAPSPDDGQARTIEPAGDLHGTIIATINARDSGEGVEYDSIILSCVEAGFSREEAEDALESLRDVDGSIIEPRFGFFRITFDSRETSSS
ncbi:MAG: hypothetical protein VYB86_03710 [Candidatus Thermoplasmatota archaeon]|nr:hypothetical protein [Candidatus Thermoplasmatota archaeon]